MNIFRVLALAMLVVNGVVHAAEHPACHDLDAPYVRHSSSQLRAIAASCRSGAIANLYYHRAYHADLLVEGETLAGLITYAKRDSAHHFDAYRSYVVMIEALAPIWYPDRLERAVFLNAEYERCAEVAELRLHGYDMVADRLERQATTPLASEE